MSENEHITDTIEELQRQIDTRQKAIDSLYAILGKPSHDTEAIREALKSSDALKLALTEDETHEALVTEIARSTTGDKIHQCGNVADGLVYLFRSYPSRAFKRKEIEDIFRKIGIKRSTAGILNALRTGPFKRMGATTNARWVFKPKSKPPEPRKLKQSKKHDRRTVAYTRPRIQRTVQRSQPTAAVSAPVNSLRSLAIKFIERTKQPATGDQLIAEFKTHGRYIQKKSLYAVLKDLERIAPDTWDIPRQQPITTKETSDGTASTGTIG